MRAVQPSGIQPALAPEFLEIDHLRVRLGSAWLLRDLSVAIGAGELLGLIGPNGVGKSTLIKAIIQLLPYKGQIRLLGEDVATLDRHARARRIAYLSQDDQLQWPISVQHLVALARHPYRGSWWRADSGPTDTDAQAIEQAMRATDVWALRERAVTELSGGERARARLARALAVEASLLLADEPVAALDPWHQLNIMDRLRAHCATGMSAVVVMHDLTLASRYCDRLLLLNRGRAVAHGVPQSVLTQEHLKDVYGIHTITGQLAGETYVLPWSVAGGDAATECALD